MRGRFIVIEGLDGAGTTTQALLLGRYLFEKGKHYVPLLTREPTLLTPEGQEIRRRLEGKLWPHEQAIDDAEYWANLFVCDRSWHLEQVVQVNREKGLYVISDRHMLSTLAYQAAQGMEMDQLIKLHQGLATPDLTLFLRVPAEIAVERIRANRSGEPEYFERKQHFLKLVEDHYERAVQKMYAEQNIRVIDGRLSIAEVAAAIVKEVDKLSD